jgi:D-sedoheptulose 7-phosphate isomerase
MSNIHQFSLDYIQRLTKLLNKVDSSILESIIIALETTMIHKSKIYLLGNGGSAATASHMVNDLGAGLRRRNIINFDIVSLADNTPVTTAIANDIGYENIFYMQLEGLLKQNDLLIAISCSGNSENILKAVKYAKTIGTPVIGLTGFDGGELKHLSDINFHVDAPSGEYCLVEDMHMILDHMLYSFYIDSKKG